MKTRLTGRGVAVVVAAAGCYTVGLVAGYPVFRLLGGMAAATVLGAAGSALRRLQVTVDRELYPDRVEAGRVAWARLVVHNPTGRRQQAFVAHDPRSDGVRPAVVRVEPLAPGRSARYSYRIPTVHRGRVLIGPFSLVRTDPLGLVRMTAAARDTSVLWVHPRRHPVRPGQGSHPRHHHEGAVRTATLRGSLDLRSLREYVYGDEPRHLHWKVSARTGRLMVREYVDPEQPRLVVLLDTRPGVLAPDAFESAVEVAASVLHASAEAGHRTRLCTTAGLVLDTAGGPDAGQELLDRLCEVAQEGRQRPDAALLAASGPAGGCLTLITGGAGTAELGRLAALRRRFGSVVVVAVASDGQRVQPPGVTLINAPDAAAAARAWNLATA